MSITFSTCFYNFNSKFDINTYSEWMKNFFYIVNDFYLVIYTNEEGIQYIEPNINKNPRIKTIIKPVEKFHNYQYKDFWIKNHEKNIVLKDRIDWKVNMLWSEKLWFVNETVKKNYFKTKYFGWCDIGYFRNRNPFDTNISDLQHWSNKKALDKIDWAKIHYACVNNNQEELIHLKNTIINKNSEGLPMTPIDPNQISIAGGFFLVHPNNIQWWCKTYEKKMLTYFHNNYLIKDDQIIIVDCVFSNIEHFFIHFENHPLYDNWFMFQRILNVLETKETENGYKISILMPIYNGIEFINESVSSVIQQTWSNWELIIGINGHEENSDIFKIAKVFGNRDKRIKVLDLYFIKGKSNALNEMIKSCKNDYVAILDVDDIWHPMKLQAQVPYFGKYDVIGTKCVYFGDMMNGIVPNIPVGDISQYNFFLGNPIINSSAIIRKPLCYWRSEVDGVEDYDLWLNLRKKNMKFYNLGEILVKHRLHQTSAFNSGGKNNNMVEDLLQWHHKNP
jgi:hypothetical protein